jgi:DMSO reductase family type II enzyme heme b subunit
LKLFQDTTWFVYDLSRTAFYKGGSSGVDIYRTLTTGLDGSPMNAYDYISDFERWNLVHYLQSLHSVKRKNNFSTIKKITSKWTDKPIVITLDESIWEMALETQISLWPLRARKNPLTKLFIRSLYNKDKIAIKIKWEDSTADSIINNNYVDQSAIQFAVNFSDIEDSPFYGMGEKGKIVNIWHWKADVRQKIIKSNKLKQKNVVKTPDSIEGMFVNPFTESSVEEMNSKGIGSLTVQPLADQKVEGRGYWYNGYWNVVFIRNLHASSKWDIDFINKDQVILAFALWDGDKKEMNSNKMVSFWQTLNFH